MSKQAQTSSRKETGAHFTPPALARFVAQKIVASMTLDTEQEIRVLDPACGSGELLLSFADALPERFRSGASLVGVDESATFAARAKARLAERTCCRVEVRQADFLDLCIENAGEPGLFDAPATLQPADAIIANPPYVRTQVLGASKSQRLASKFDLSGRLDLYQAFLVGMTQMLRPGGVLGVITSNRFLSTKSGGATRRFLARAYDIRAVYDLGDTKLFEEAAVLPAIFVGVKKSTANTRVNDKARFMRIYEDRTAASEERETTEEVDAACDLLRCEEDGLFSVGKRTFSVASGVLSLPASPSEPWSLTTDGEASWLSTVEANAACRFGDIVDIRVGVKTNADEVFVRDDWSELPSVPELEEDLLCDLLTSACASRWTRRQVPLSRVLYPHEVRRGKRNAVDLNDYPKAAAYLARHRDRLEERTYLLEAGREWFELWVPQNPSAWQQPKVVFPDISAEPKFFYDADGCVVKGNCYWFTLDGAQDRDLLFLLQGVANTRLATRYHDLSFNNKLYAGRRRYLTQYVKKYPLPDPNSDVAERIATLAKELVFEVGGESERQRKENELEETVAAAFGVSPITRKSRRASESVSSG